MNQSNNKSSLISPDGLNKDDQNARGGDFSKNSQSLPIEEETELEKKKQKLLNEKSKSSYYELSVANLARKTAEANRRTAKVNAEKSSIEHDLLKLKQENEWEGGVDKIIKWLKIAFLTLFLLTLTGIVCLGLFYLYRFVTEEPIIQTVTETVTETIEKEVIPEECTQVRRNGKIYVSCDGVTVKGAPTLAESGVDEIPELINE
ncbi:hypothetical protein CTM88_06570 [Photobacterium aquimaris]|uniref:Uncharacterized protein n=1 Tax=Photobacterium aquimaris TaxID=512643 RepID=A0A2T3IP50_9GAMM|nr:hypothetical protein [Photobacterium aquimaris]OBU20176.1 hypothetical protein AYY20_16335 [Photobacterium aquimaris]PSU30129.1 hypothetical protein CTM88_06570 [Photobacterium aquimaris]